MIIMELLKKVDFFGESFKLNFDKNKRFNTELGGILTIIIFCVSFSLVVSLAKVVIYHTLPRTNSVLLYNEYAPKIDISKQLLFAFGFQLSNAPVIRLNDPSYFTYSVAKYVVDRTSGTYESKQVDIPIVNCSEKMDRWVSDKFNYTGDFIRNDLGPMLCFETNNGTMEGAFISNYFENFKIKVSRCKNGTSRGVVCKSDSQINAALNNGNFQLYFTNRYIDVFNFENPMVEFFDNYFIKIDPKIAKFVDTFFQLVNVTTDEGYVFEDKKTNSYAVFDKYREQSDSNGADTKIITLYINSSQYFRDVSRNYMKLPELAATVGGILNICLVIGKIVTRYFGSYVMKLQLMNRLYFFNNSEDSTHELLHEESNEVLNTNTAVNLNPFSSSNSKNQSRNYLKTYTFNIQSFMNEENAINAINQDEREEQSVSDISYSSENVGIIVLDKKKNPSQIDTDKLKAIENKENNMERPSVNFQLKLLSEGQHIELLENIKKEFDNNPTEKSDSKVLRTKVFEEITKHKKNQKGSLNYGLKELLAISLCFCFDKHKKNSQIFEIGEIKLNNYMDYFGVVRLLQEFEKLKGTIFCEKRRELFEHANKPVINLESNNLEKLVEEVRQSHDNKEINYEELYRNYKQLYLSKSKKDYDVRLLAKIDSEIKHPFNMLLSRERILEGKKL